MTARLASIVITLDMETIQDAHLCINADVVKESILQTPKIKLKQQVEIFISGLQFSDSFAFLTSLIMVIYSAACQGFGFQKVGNFSPK